MGILLALLSGVIGGTLVPLVFEYFKLKKQYLREQIDHLYGPIYFCIVYAQANYNQAKKLGEAHQVLVNKQYSEGPTTQQKLDEIFKNALEIENEYSHSGFSINKKIFEIIQKNYSYIDIDDISIFEDYLTNFSRISVEIEKKMKLEPEI